MGISLKEYIAAFGKWGFLMAAIIVGDVVGIVQSLNTDFLLPQWGWWLILVVILLVSPFIAFHKLRVKCENIQRELDAQKNKKAIVLKIDDFIGKGNDLLAIMPSSIERLEDFDNNSMNINKWATNVRNFLKPLGYERYFTTNPGLNKEENEEQDDPRKQTLAIARNYMRIRLQRLLEIRRQLGD